MQLPQHPFPRGSVSLVVSTPPPCFRFARRTFACFDARESHAVRSPDSRKIKVVPFEDGPFDFPGFVLEDLVGEKNAIGMMKAFVKLEAEKLKQTEDLRWDDATTKAWAFLERAGEIDYLRDTSGGLRRRCITSVS